MYISAVDITFEINFKHYFQVTNITTLQGHIHVSGNFYLQFCMI
jgi:hypothetical protein